MIVPTRQCAFLIFVFAVPSCLLTTFGTRHAGVGGTDAGALGVTVFDAADCGPAPTALIAATLNV